MANEEKLDWIYNGANSLVDREDYLLGRKVDKPLEQLNDDEKEKKFVLPTPKNHVEHECIPPSIRDFNKIVQAEQVDLSAKLQEDPLVAIKKREEEARRQFLQNPVQLKKLQDALQKQNSSKKKHNKKRLSESELDEQIKRKLKGLKKQGKKDKKDALDTILMHKFNTLKDKLSEEDLNDILNGKVSDGSEDEKPKEKKRKDSESEEERDRKRVESRRKDYDRNRRRGEEDTYRRRQDYHHRRERDSKRSRSRSKERASKDRKYHQNESSKKSSSSEAGRKTKVVSEEDSSDSELDKKIMAQLKVLRGEAESKTEKKVMYPAKPPQKDSSSDSSPERNYSDSEEEKPPKKSFGLVTSTGKKIAFKNKVEASKNVEVKPSKKVVETQTSKQKHVKRMTDEEKERLRKEMMVNAKSRDKEREHTVRRHNDKDRREEETVIKKYDSEVIRSELMKSAKNLTVEQRIKSNLNNIQRSSRHMDQNFSKR